MTPEQDARFRKIIVEHLGADLEKVTDSASFADDLGADSLDAIEVVMAVEEEFDIEILDEEAETILTVGEALSHLSKRLS